VPVPDLVLFDCDGVLVDSEGTANELLASILREHGASLTARQAEAIFIGQSVDAIRSSCAERFDIALAGNWHEDYYRRLLPALAGVSPIPGANEVVGLLSETELRFCVASQGPLEKMMVTLGATGLLDHFKGHIFSAKSVNRPKPAPDLFLYAAKAMDAKPSNCVVIEDSVLGVQAGIAAGMRVLAYCPRSSACSMRELGAHPFHRMNEVPGLLGLDTHSRDLRHRG
jgi:HAD superfamily hydrolase (TIGR01509 family)